MSDSTRPEIEAAPSPRSTTSDSRPAELTARDEEFLYLVGDGSDLMRAGRIDEALREFDRALAISPTNEQALNLKGLCLFRLGRGEEASRVFESLVEQNSDEPSIRLNLAMVYLKLGAFPKARDALVRVLEKNPSHPRAKNLMGMVRERLGEPASDPPAIVGVLAVDEPVPAPPSDLEFGDDDVPEPPTLSELDFAIAMGDDGGQAVAFGFSTFSDDESRLDVDASAPEGSEVPAPPELAFGGSDDETLDVPAPAEDDFSDLNAGLDDQESAPADPSAKAALHDVDEAPPTPLERTLPAYDVAAFNAHLARKEAEKFAREAELARQVATATSAARVSAEVASVVDDAPVQPEQATGDVPLPSRPAEKLSVGAEAAALVAASTAALRREKAPAPPAERPRGSVGFSLDDGKADPVAESATTAPHVHEGTRVSSLVERSTPRADGRLENGLLSIPFKDVLYLRTDLMIALAGELEVEPVNRRYRGRRTDSFFGGLAAPLSAAMGTGTALVNVDDQVVTVIRLEGEDVYLLEGGILAFSDGIVWENGRLPGEKGDDLDIVHLRGEGRIYLLSARPVVGLSIGSEEPATLRATSLVGWQGQVVPFRGPYPGLPETVERPAIIRFEGTGTVLVG